MTFSVVVPICHAIKWNYIKFWPCKIQLGFYQRPRIGLLIMNLWDVGWHQGNQESPFVFSHFNCWLAEVTLIAFGLESWRNMARLLPIDISSTTPSFNCKHRRQWRLININHILKSINNRYGLKLSQFEDFPKYNLGNALTWDIILKVSRNYIEYTRTLLIGALEMLILGELQ